MKNIQSYPENIRSYILNSAKYHALKLINQGYYPFYELEDLEQEILALFLYKINKYSYDESKSSYKSWVTMIIKNICYDLIQKAIKYKKYFSKTSLNDLLSSDNQDSNEIIDFIADETANTFEEYYNFNQKEKILNEINNFPDELKELCRMLQDKNVTEISKELNISRKTIYKRINKIKMLLKKYNTD